MDVMEYKVTYWLDNGCDRTMEVDGTVTFSRSSDAHYGNGYYMAVESKIEPFGCSLLDIRYDRTFSARKAISFITKFFDERFDGEDGAWKLTGIKVGAHHDDDKNRC